MTLNARLQLESLDERWLPDATQTSGGMPPGLIHEGLPPNSTLMDTPEFRAQLIKVQEEMSKLDGICREYAVRKVGLEYNERELEAMKARLDRLVEEGLPQGDLPVEIATQQGLVNVLRVLVAGEAAKYAAQVPVVRAEIAALNALVPGANFGANLPDLEKYVTLEAILYETTPPPLPPGVG